MIPLVKPYIPKEEVLMPKLQEVLYSGMVAQGPIVEKFEQAFQKRVGTGFSISVNSGTAALHIALILCEVGSGDEVVSTALTAEPTNVAIKMTGADIVYADIDESTGCICPKSIESVITPKTKAIIVVDYAGISVDVFNIKKVSEKFNIPVIHDVAHSFNTSFQNKLPGNHFEFTTYSFQAIKHITTIDGGILHVLDIVKAKKAKLIRWFGLDKGISRANNNVKIQGYKYHMNDVTAQIGLVQLESLSEHLPYYRLNQIFYHKELARIKQVELIHDYEGCESHMWIYTFKAKNSSELIRYLNSKGIGASKLHKLNIEHDFLKGKYPTKLEKMRNFYSEMVHIPSGWWVNEIDRLNIVSHIKEFYRIMEKGPNQNEYNH